MTESAGGPDVSCLSSPTLAWTTAVCILASSSSWPLLLAAASCGGPIDAVGSGGVEAPAFAADATGAMSATE